MRITKLLFFLLVLAGPVFAQSGKITGLVKDQNSGETLPGANVVIMGTMMGSATDLDGRFLILNVPPGTYTIQARFSGYSPTTVQEVIVRQGLTTELNFSLQEEVIAGEEVVVTAQQPTVLKDVTSSESRVSASEIAKLPVLELADVVKLQAGVNVANDGAIHIRGGRSTEVSYIVDGIRVTDDFNRSQGLRVENQSIEELQIVSGTFNAEFGQAMSGIVNIATKSGGNKYRGNVNLTGGSYYVHDQELWRDVPNRVSELQPLNQRQLSMTLEGPIIKDKLTFFTSFRGWKDNGYLRGRNAYSAQGQWAAYYPAGTTANNLVDPFGNKVNLSQPWYTFIPDTTLRGRRGAWLFDSGRRDSSIVNMGTEQTVNGLVNLLYTMNKQWKLNLITSYSQEEYLGFNHGYRLVGYGPVNPFNRENSMVNLKVTYTPSAKTFVIANIARTSQREWQRLFESPTDKRYLPVAGGMTPGDPLVLDMTNPDDPAVIGTLSPGEVPGGNFLGTPGLYSFANRGTNFSRTDRQTSSIRGKVELSSQVNKRHFVKAGLEMQFDQVSFDDASVVFQNNTFVEQTLAGGRQQFDQNPFVGAMFVQDKIEFDKFIVNIGLRFDYFDANGRVPVDPKDPNIFRPLNPNSPWFGMSDEQLNATLADREKVWWRSVKPRTQISPRFGIAYSVSPKSVVHFSYGHFFQMPTYGQLFSQSLITLPQASGVYGGYGNPDLNPERTIQYEIGLKQEIFEGTAVEVTAFYRDSRDYVANLGIQETYNPGLFYRKNVNLAFAKSRGLTASLNQTLSREFNFAIDYTYTRVEGSTTNEGALSANAVGLGRITGQQQQDVYNFLILQGWDRTNILNLQLFYNKKSFGANMTGQYQSGQPYTPFIPIAVRNGLGASQRDLSNLSRMPSTFVINLSAYKNFEIAKQKANLTVNVFNLLDSKLITGVYADSGEPNRPFFIPAADVAPYFLNTPSNYGRPRRIQVALNVSF